MTTLVPHTIIFWILGGMGGVHSQVVTIRMGILLSGDGWKTGNDSYPAAEIAIKDLEEYSKSWDRPLKIETKIEITYCSESASYAAAHNLLEWGAQVIIGPACTTACIPVSLMAKEYNVPVISYACSGTILSQKEIYPNFARSSESLSGASTLLMKVFGRWDFKLYSIMTTTQKINVDLAIDFVTQMRDATALGIEENAEDRFKLKQLSTVVASLAVQDDAIQEGTKEQLDSFLSDAWVFFIPTYDGDANFILENAAKEVADTFGVDKTEAWQKTNYAWFRYQSFVQSEYKDYYENVFSLENDTPHKSFPAAYDAFLAKFEDQDAVLKGKPEAVKLYLAYMYNAITAWGTAYKKTGATYSERDWKYEAIIGQLSDLEYTGAYRLETLNDKAEPANAIWNLRQYQDGAFVDVVTQHLEDPGMFTVHNDKVRWPNDKKVDPCEDNRCLTAGTDNTVLFAVVGICVVLVVAVIAAAGFIIHRQRTRNNEDRKVEWKIPFSELDFAVKKSVSGSRKFGVDDKPSDISVARWNHTFVVVKNLTVANITITKETLEDIYVIKKETHPNLEAFYGLCDDPGYCSVITEYCSKGSLEDLAHNDNVHLDWMFKLSLVIDVAKGLRYLHNSTFGYHGNLRTSNCIVDSHWVCKVADFGLKNMYREFEDTKQEKPMNKGANVREGTSEKERLISGKGNGVFNLTSYSSKDGGLKTSTVPTHHLFYAAPEKLWPSSKERSPKEVQKCDTYSFSIVMFELFAREAPYDTAEILPEKIIQKVRNRESPPYRPNLELMHITDKTSYEQVGAEDSANAVPAEAIELMKQCWREMPFERNNMSDTVQALEDMNPDRSLSITDRVVKMMEKYSEDLENKVAMKTHQLRSQQAGKSLSKYLPRKVIDQIEKGLEVEKAENKYITGAAVKVKVLEERDQIAAINAYEELNHTEVVTRDIYQVVDSNGHTVVISGLYNEEAAPHQMMEYARTLLREASEKNITIKVALHSGVASGGLILADTSNPRLCITSNLATQLDALLENANFGDIILTDTARKDIPEDMQIKPHGELKLLGESIETFLLQTATTTTTTTQSESPVEEINHRIEPVATKQIPNGTDSKHIV
ncbi:atrial natriuretic peptide receptor 2-like isoform X1 [Bolinopsis microptera]|uniref:atrial natriuretic peptide receptor 2-like isoform X1 n=2 Tax=Bolinopsis microptera TaxID=2820187 RepID=UPI00307A9528